MFIFLPTRWLEGQNFALGICICKLVLDQPDSVGTWSPGNMSESDKLLFILNFFNSCQ